MAAVVAELMAVLELWEQEGRILLEPMVRIQVMQPPRQQIEVAQVALEARHQPLEVLVQMVLLL